jgi:PhnB protein
MHIVTLQLTPFIWMDGNAMEAIHFYKSSLDAKIEYTQTFGDGPEDPERPLSDSLKQRIAHAVLKIEDTIVMMADVFPGRPLRSGNQVSICITTNEIEKSKRIYECLKQDGQVDLPLQKTHFSSGYAMVTDKFGVTFQIFTTSTAEAVNKGHEKNL